MDPCELCGGEGAYKLPGDRTLICPVCRKNTPGDSAESQPGHQATLATAEENQQEEQSITMKPPFWIEGKFGVCIYIRTPRSEPCYLTGGAIATKADLEGAIRFLRVLQDTLSD